MELLINPTSFECATKLIENNIDQIFVGTKEFCTRNNCNLTLIEIEKLISIKKNTKVLILVNKFFFEFEIDNLIKYLLEISKLDINGIIFSDYAVVQILYENNINNINLIYNPETLVTNYGQFDFYKKNNINEVSLARELTKENILEILNNKNTMKIQIQVGGYEYIMHTKWNLLTNFKKSHKIKQNLNNKKLYIYEEKRNYPMLIIEDHNNTHILTSYNICLLKKLNDLKDVDTFRIDSFLHNEEWTIKNAIIYQEIINDIKKNNYDLNKVNKYYDELKAYGEDLSEGFYEINNNNLKYLPNDLKLEWNND